MITFTAQSSQVHPLSLWPPPKQKKKEEIKERRKENTQSTLYCSYTQHEHGQSPSGQPVNETETFPTPAPPETINCENLHFSIFVTTFFVN